MIPDMETSETSRRRGRPRIRGPVTPFAHRLTRAMSDRGMDTFALSREIQVSCQSLYTYQNRTIPTLDIVFRIADALNVRPEWLAWGLEGEGNHD